MDVGLSDRVNLNLFRSSFLIFSHDISNFDIYLLWKLNTLIDTAKINANSIANPTTTVATTPRKS